MGQMGGYRLVSRLPPEGMEEVAPGWTAVRGFALPERPWDLGHRRLVVHAVVADEAAAISAVEAVTRGACLVLEVDLPASLRRTLLEDLERAAPPDADRFDEVDRRLLDALAVGATVTGAAQAIGLSRRSASRRLAALRSALGVATTAEAIAAWVGRSQR